MNNVSSKFWFVIRKKYFYGNWQQHLFGSLSFLWYIKIILVFLYFVTTRSKHNLHVRCSQCVDTLDKFFRTLRAYIFSFWFRLGFRLSLSWKAKVISLKICSGYLKVKNRCRSVNIRNHTRMVAWQYKYAWRVACQSDKIPIPNGCNLILLIWILIRFNRIQCNKKRRLQSFEIWWHYEATLRVTTKYWQRSHKWSKNIEVAIRGWPQNMKIL